MRESQEVYPILLYEEVTFSYGGGEYLVATSSFGTVRILDARTYQPEIPFGETSFNSYLLARTDRGIMLFEQVFRDLRGQGWRLVAYWKDEDGLTYTEEKERFFFIYDNLIPEMVSERPWMKRGNKL